MKRFLAVIGLIMTLLLVLFAAAEYSQISFVTAPTPWFEKNSPATALLAILLLSADIVIPVPSSVMMTVNGALFGIWLGALVSLLGGLGAALIGFSLGRWMTPLVQGWVSQQEWEQARRLLATWGGIGIIVTRPIPILAETMSIAAGTSLSCKEVLWASFWGLLPIALLYSISGATATDLKTSFASFFISLTMASVFWWIGKKYFKK
ncbi:MAG: VTT domain-containing protein [Syntrophomonadaceae bacterium]|nr:VTT domain-containing protein [Syntrophomonadaceae bacterium]